MEYKISLNEDKKDSILKETKQKIILIQLIYGIIIAFLLSSPFIFINQFALFVLISILIAIGITIMFSHNALKTIDRSHEEIIVKDESFTFSFVDNNKSYHNSKFLNGDIWERDEVEFHFKDIKKIEVNHSYNLIIIYGPMDFRLFKDYQRKIIKKVLRVDTPKNCVVLTNAYEEMEQFVRYISNETKLPLSHVYLPVPMKKYEKII